jgi:hypothetical protein
VFAEFIVVMIMFLVSSQMGTDSEIYQQLAALAAL